MNEINSSIKQDKYNQESDGLNGIQKSFPTI